MLDTNGKKPLNPVLPWHFCLFDFARRPYFLVQCFLNLNKIQTAFKKKKILKDPQEIIKTQIGKILTKKPCIFFKLQIITIKVKF